MAAPYLYALCFTRSLLIFLLFTIMMFNNNSYSSAAPPPPMCHQDESSALLKFKQSLSLNQSTSRDPSAYPKTGSWKLITKGGEIIDCCSWDGVECDNHTGHVIGLDLSSSFLYGSITANSSIFSLVHLQSLNLADNNFVRSQIPPEISHLSSLSSLNLSMSAFSGQIPSELLRLSKLASLDLSINKLYGEFPGGIFHQPDLLFLNVSYNRNLTGYLPEFNQSSSLKDLRISRTNFSGKLPVSIGNLKALNSLVLSECYFSGSIPASLGNLTQLTRLYLFSNNFNVGKLSWIGKLTKLIWLSVRDTNLYGEIPSSLANLTQLTDLQIGYNNFYAGEIPSWLMNMTQLILIDISQSQLQGQISSSFSQFNNLETLFLDHNNLSGTVDADIFLNLKKLTQLTLSYNKISFLTNPRHINSTLPQLHILGLSFCNLSEIPLFLQFQNQLEVLYLSFNKIHGQIPQWIWNISETLESIDLANNSLTGFEQNPIVLQGVGLRFLSLDYNMLQGNLPVPPPNTISYRVSHNRLTGNIPPLICHASSLLLLDLSNNNMSGAIPQCLVNSLMILNLKSNNFSGTIPRVYTRECNLKMMDLSQNQFKGQLPRSLENCKMFQVLDLADNQMEDTFPFWLGSLPQLQVLILRSNKFHGEIGSPRITSEFSMLRIVDLSNNSFTGDLPLEYIQSWKAMKVVHVDLLTFMQTTTFSQTTSIGFTDNYMYSITITNKGVKTQYVKILNIFFAVDLSSNKFRGEIPESVGSLKGLQLLNLSNNHLTGPIPSFLGNLTNLESLDLSRNKLSGVIPQQFVQELNFLAFLNVSNNLLSGPIPQGGQFATFQNNSYEENSALCGMPLSTKCGAVQSPIPLPPDDDDDDDDDSDEFPSGVDWVVIFTGFGGGLVVGLVFGNILTNRHHEWFVEKFGRQRKQITWS